MPPLPPWHKVVRLKPELRSGELALADFAADLHEVVTQAGKRPIYEDPAKFFALTYPTHALRDLVRDVAARLAGQSPKAVRQLEITYGGGKTHTLIALHHLFRDPARLPDIAAVKEFREHADHDLPKAATAALCFDKIDVEKGVETQGPGGEKRTLRHPWSVLAFQLLGADGLRLLHADNENEERDTPPAENLIVQLIERQQQDGRSTIILLDEVMMYAHAKALADPAWRVHMPNFFQYLTQAAGKVDRAAIVASLLATDPSRMTDPLGRDLLDAIAQIFRRMREEGVQPVQKDDVAEVLRRRFFEPDSIRDPNAHKAHVIGVVKGVAKMDDNIKSNKSDAEKRFQHSFPFHPDLTDVLYGRWTQIDGFQRTRGVLRILATALRDAEAWDDSPLVGPAALLAGPKSTNVSEAVRELANVASTDKVQGRRIEWTPLLESELDHARAVQKDFPALRKGREAEQAVMAVFLYSQPTGRKANTGELLRMIGGSAPDRIELEKGLHRWRDTSWYLDDADAEDDPGRLPKSWRLGNAPNLKQMHDEACRHRVTAEMVEARFAEVVRKTASLRTGAAAAGAKVHILPQHPNDIADDGNFRYAILGAEAVSDSGKPSRAARKFLDETTTPAKPRVNRNAVVIAAPSRIGMEAARTMVRALLGWEDVAAQLKGQEVDPLRAQRLRNRKRKAAQELPSVVRQAYGIVVTVDVDNSVHAFKLKASGNPLFEEIKKHEKTRLTDTQVNAEAMLPDTPYDLWREEEESRYVHHLATAFARYPRLPKVLKPKLVVETVLDGVKRGVFVGRIKRPDGSFRTWWREPVDPAAASDEMLEVALPAKAALARLDERLLAPGKLPALWKQGEGDGGGEVGGDPDGAHPDGAHPDGAHPSLKVADLLDYFAGGHVAVIPHENYDDEIPIPACDREQVLEAVRRAVAKGIVWLTNHPSTVWKEEIPAGTLNDAATLRAPPPSVAPQELTPEQAPEAWQDGRANGASLTSALSQKRSIAVPWGVVHEGIGAAVKGRWLALAKGSRPVEGTTYEKAAQLVLERPDAQPAVVKPLQPTAARLDAAQLQDLADSIPDLLDAVGGAELRFRVAVHVEGKLGADGRAKVDALLAKVSQKLKLPPGAGT